jgi:hypothetical protein
MEIENAQFTGPEKNTIQATIDGTVWFVPVAAGNQHYDEIVEQDIRVAEPDDGG